MKLGRKSRGSEVLNYFRNVQGAHGLSPADLDVSLMVSRVERTSGDHQVKDGKQEGPHYGNRYDIFLLF